MRRIFKTTTALVACLSIITPQLALAQDQQAQDGQQLILPKQKQKQAEEGQAQKPEQQQQNQQPQQKPRAERQAKEQPQQQEPAQAEQQQEPRRQVQPRQEEPQPGKPAAGQDAPQAKQQQAAEPARAPEEKPAVTQAQEPAPKPPVVEAETPRAKPADADQAAGRAEQLREDAQKQPATKPDSAKSVTTADPAPDRKPDEPQRDQPSVQARQPAAESKDMPDAEALKERLEARDQDQPAPGQPQPGEAAQKPEPRRQQADGEQQRRQDGQQQTGEDQPRQEQASDQQQRRQDDPQQAGQDTPAAPGAAELARRLQEQQQDQASGQQQDQQGQPGQPQPGEVQAPEARVTPNEVAKRAAENPPPVAAAALAAAGAQEQQQQGQVDEVQITKDNARRSDQDFENAIIQGLNGDQQREDQRSEARRDDDDDDDNLKDIGKLLLAGAAGFAVGKMLSNDRQVALNTGDRVVVTLPDGSQQVIKDDNALLYQPGSNVRTETFDDGSTRTTVVREDGSRVVTIRDANMNILRRTLVRADGSETRLIDDTAAEPVRISTLPAPPPVEISRGPLDEAALREALRREANVDRRFTLGQIRDIPEVRALVAPVNVPEITFETGSSAITPDQAQQLATLGKVIRDSVDQNPAEIYMIEGYTDAVGSDAANLALSDRRAESVALALTEYFQVPPENMVVQGYGEQFLLVPSEGAERDNRRVAVRRITDLMEQN